MTVHWERRRYSAREFEAAWRASSSYNELCSRLNLAQTGGVLSSLKKAAAELKLDREDMAVRTRPGSISNGDKSPLSLYLRNGVAWSRFGATIKRRLFSEGVFEKKCYECGLDSWIGVPIPLTIDHIDGDNSNNRVENLKPLCWNCHALTPTFGARNQRRASSRLSACACGQPKDRRSTECLSCARRTLSKHRDSTYPSTPELVEGVEEHGYVQYARKIVLSNTGLKKLLARRGLEELPKRRKFAYT